MLKVFKAETRSESDHVAPQPDTFPVRRWHTSVSPERVRCAATSESVTSLRSGTNSASKEHFSLEAEHTNLKRNSK